MVISFQPHDPTNEEIFDIIQGIVSDLLSKYHLKLNHKKMQIINLYNANHVRITGVNIVKKRNFRGEIYKDIEVVSLLSM